MITTLETTPAMQGDRAQLDSLLPVSLRGKLLFRAVARRLVVRAREEGYSTLKAFAEAYMFGPEKWPCRGWGCESTAKIVEGWALYGPGLFNPARIAVGAA
jgi:hypothetical protein